MPKNSNSLLIQHAKHALSRGGRRAGTFCKIGLLRLNLVIILIEKNDVTLLKW